MTFYAEAHLSKEKHIFPFKDLTIFIVPDVYITTVSKSNPNSKGRSAAFFTILPACLTILILVQM